MKGRQPNKRYKTSKKSKTGRKDRVLITELPVHEHQAVHEALMYAEDILQRSQIPFFLLDEVAKKIWETDLPQLNIREIDIGIMERHFTESGRKILQMLEPDIEKHNKTYSFKFNKVPVVIWIINSEYDVLQNPDFRWYTTSEFRIPNPFKVYWNKRDIIARGI